MLIGERKENRGKRRGFARTLLIVAIACLLAAGALPESALAATHSFRSTTIYADGTRTAKFTCNGMKGLCCEAGAYSTYSGSASLSRMKNTTDAAHCAYYYGYRKGWLSGSGGHRLARLLSYCMGHGTGGDFKNSYMKSLLAAAKKTDVPAGFECWLCKPAGSSKQDFIVWRFPKGKLRVLKTSADTALSKKGSYSLAGITIKVYSDAACKSCVKTLTTKKDGSTGGAFSLHVGTYFVKETDVPDSTGYKKNTAVSKVSIRADQTSVATVKIANTPDTGSVTIHKAITGEWNDGDGSSFRFVLTGKTSGKKYDLVTGAGGTASVTGLPFGKYTLKEILTEEQQKRFTDKTGVQTLTLSKGSKTQNLTVQRVNHYEPRQKLKIIKRTGDDGSPAGFRFLLSWRLADNGTLSAEEIVKATEPQMQLAPGQAAGIWQIADPLQVKEINEAAAQGRTGVFTVRLRNTVTTTKMEPEEESDTDGDSDDEANEPAEMTPVSMTEDIHIDVKVCLTGNVETAPGQTESAAGTIKKDEPIQADCGSCSVRYSDIEFYGAATTGTQTIETDETGQYLSEQIRPGVYTVTEQMTENQKLRYHQPQRQEKTLEKGSGETLCFTFENRPVRVPVRLKKASADGRIQDIEFTISGTPAFADQPMEDITVCTDDKGIADFGMLYPGSYIVEETGFDAAAYVNGYPMEGKDRPAFAFTITGEELTEKQIEEGETLWLGGESGRGKATEEPAVFRNIPFVDLWLTKVDGTTHGFLPGAEFSLRDEDDALAAQFRIDADEDGMPKPVTIRTNGTVTMEAAEETVGNTAVVIGSSGKEEEKEYPCIVLHGLTEGSKYTLTEETAPQGYAPIEKPYVFTVTLDENGEPMLNTCDEYGTGIDAAARRGTLVVVNELPSITTIALDRDTREHIANAAESVVLQDTCRVTNLVEGQTYTMVARLMDTTAYRSSGREGDVRQVMADGAVVMGQLTFEAEAKEQILTVPLKVNAASLAGHSTVIYESLYTGEYQAKAVRQPEPIAGEADPDNESQTVVFPKIRTAAALIGGNTIEDKVTYRDLIPGRTYLLQGRLINKASGKQLEKVTGETVFQADGSGAGSVTVKFRLDGSTLGKNGLELVAFEKCFLVKEDNDGKKELRQVASHEDLEDEEQCVRMPGGSVPKTGDPFHLSAAAILTAALIVSGLLCRRRICR